MRNLHTNGIYSVVIQLMYTDPNPKLDYRDSRKGEFNTEVNKQIMIKQLKKTLNL